MNTMQGVQAMTSVGTAGGSVANLLTGQIYERAPYSGMARFAITGDAAGDLRVTIFVGGRAVMAESPVSRAAVMPVVPDHVIATAPMRAGEQITITGRNTAATTSINFFWRVDLRPRR